MARLTSQEMQELVQEFGEVKFTRKQLKLIRAILNHTTKTLVHEFDKKDKDRSQSFQLALSKLSEINWNIADTMQEVSPSFKRDKWFDKDNYTFRARRIW